MSILGKPGSGTWTFSAAAFGANSCPAPDSLYMIEEGSGQMVNSGKDSGSYDTASNSGVYTGAAASGDSYVAYTASSSQESAWSGVFGITAYPFTIAVVFNDSTNRASAQAIMSLADASAGNVKYGVEILSGEQPSMKAQNTAAINKSSGLVVNDGAWHLIVVTFTSATDRDIYVDGSTVVNDSNSATFNSNTDVAKLGARADSTVSHYLDGGIGGVMVWKSASLSAAQVQTDLYNSGDCWGFLSTSTGILPSGILIGNIDSGIFL